MPKISLCMIVKDEEQNIRRCIESARSHVYEMVIIDAGSQDGTRGICESLGAKVYNFDWSDDFSAARNFGLKKASGDWILWMDADEELCMLDFAALQNMLEVQNPDLVCTRLLHYCGDKPADAYNSYRSTGFRLFKNGIGLRFVGPIHEQLDISSLIETVQMEPTPFFYIGHYGYMQSAQAYKAQRNMEALVRQREREPDNAWLEYHMAAELYRLGELEQALQTVNEVILEFVQKGVVPPSLAYKLKYDILVEQKKFEEAYPAIEKALSLYPDYVDLHYYKGKILYGLGRYDEATRAFIYALVLGESDPRYLIRTGVGSFKALFQLGQCYEKQQKNTAALEAYRQVLALHPKFERADERRKVLENSAG